MLPLPPFSNCAQTLKLIGYIKHYKVIVLIGSGSTYSFHMWVVEETHFYVHHILNLQIIIENGGIVKCGGWCENMKLQMGDYHLKTHIFVINISGCNIVFGLNGSGL